jgi:hypothetical protein
MILALMWRKKMEAMKERERTRTMNGSLLVGQPGVVRATRKTDTRRPGESSVYSLSIVFELPPAPAAREELGFETVLFARRLCAVCESL